MRWAETIRRTGPILILLLCMVGYLAAAGWNLGLPGLHYDEAKEAGLNALELLRGDPVTAFRGVAVTVGPWTLPLMVQDYIGALNVYLVLPFLAATGVGVPNVRWPAVITGLVTLWLVERLVSTWWMWMGPREAAAWGGEGAGDPGRIPVTWVGVGSVALLALSPSFVFWSRQGIFVTNLIQPLTILALWQGLCWLRTGRPAAFIYTGLAAGLALYAKLLAGWVLGPFAVLALGAYWVRRNRTAQGTEYTGPHLTVGLLAGGVATFLAVLAPLVWFNLQTGGTLAQVGSSLSQSYYGIDNLDWRTNLPVRAGQLIQTLRGDHFWYLGGVYANPLAPWLALVGVMGVFRHPRLVGWPLLIGFGALGLSLFTLSDLFITHYALLQPLVVGTIVLGWAAWVPRPRLTGAALGIFLLLTGVWTGLDLRATLRYHAALDQSGGLADHSDATYHLAYYLRYNGLGAPIALDWGMDAPVRFLSDNTVRPIEIFGYAAPAAPDADYGQRLELFLGNPENVYLLRSPEYTVFGGRREGFLDAAAARNATPRLETTFSQRDGTPLFELWRVD